MSDPEAGMDPPDTEVDREEPSGDEAASPLERLQGRRVLHVTLLLILAVPAWVWLTRPSSPGDPAVPGGVEVDEAAPDFTLDLFDGHQLHPQRVSEPRPKTGGDELLGLLVRTLSRGDARLRCGRQPSSRGSQHT